MKPAADLTLPSGNEVSSEGTWSYTARLHRILQERLWFYSAQLQADLESILWHSGSLSTQSGCGFISPSDSSQMPCPAFPSERTVQSDIVSRRWKSGVLAMVNSDADTKSTVNVSCLGAECSMDTQLKDRGGKLAGIVLWLCLGKFPEGSSPGRNQSTPHSPAFTKYCTETEGTKEGRGIGAAY